MQLFELGQPIPRGEQGLQVSVCLTGDWNLPTPNAQLALENLRGNLVSVSRGQFDGRQFGL